MRPTHLLAALALLYPMIAARAQEPAVSVDHGFAPSGNVTVIARFQEAQPSGLAALPDGRLVLSFPRSSTDHGGPRLGVWKDGVLSAWPDAAAQQRFVSPLGMTIDARGRLWLLDEGLVAGQKTPPRPRLFAIDPPTGRIIEDIPLAAPGALPDTHVNDVRVDVTHGRAGTAYISDMSFGDHPGIIVVDLASRTARRVLTGAREVSPEPGFAMMVDGELHRFDPGHPRIAAGAIDGIVLSADSKRLYWTALAGRRLHSLPTALLADPAVPEARLRAAIRDEGEVGVADGMAAGPDGSLFFTDIERHAIERRWPDGDLSTVARDPRLIAPDSIGLTPDGLFVTVGQWSRLPAFHDGRDLVERPWFVVHVDWPSRDRR
ncbi:SMP-30/gluconolactonase/LRE family protein [Sphingomonas oryzagri]